MAGKFNATAQAERWKQHKCIGCGSTYRYLMKREATGTASSKRAAQDVAEDKLEQAFIDEVELRACPNCGTYQPDMIADTVGAGHGCAMIFLAIFLVGALVSGAFVGYGFLPWPVLYSVISWSMVVLCVLMILLQVTLLSRNLNANLNANLNESFRFVDDGTMTLETRGQPPESVRPSAHQFSSGLRTVYLSILGFGFLVILSGEFTRFALNWPANSNCDPAIVGPGDVTAVYFSNQVDTIGGRFNGRATARVMNADEVGLKKPELSATTKNDDWGGIIVGKRTRPQSTRPWVEVAIPDMPELASKTLTLRVTLDAQYPAPSEARGFENKSQTFDETMEIKLSPANAGLISRGLWWGGLVLGGAIIVAMSYWRYRHAKAIGRAALPSHVV